MRVPSSFVSSVAGVRPWYERHFLSHFYISRSSIRHSGMSPLISPSTQSQNATSGAQTTAHTHLHAHTPNPSMPGAPPPVGALAPHDATGPPPVPRVHPRADVQPHRRPIPFPFKKRAEDSATPPLIPHHPGQPSTSAESSHDERPVLEESSLAPLVGPVRIAPLPVVTKRRNDSKKAAHIEKRKRYLETCALVDSFGEMSVTCKACQRNVTLGAPYLLRAWRKHLREDTRCIEKRVAMVECGKLSLSVLELKHPWAPPRIK